MIIWSTGFLFCYKKTVMPKKKVITVWNLLKNVYQVYHSKQENQKEKKRKEKRRKNKTVFRGCTVTWISTNSLQMFYDLPTTVQTFPFHTEHTNPQAYPRLEFNVLLFESLSSHEEVNWIPTDPLKHLLSGGP